MQNLGLSVPLNRSKSVRLYLDTRPATAPLIRTCFRVPYAVSDACWDAQEGYLPHLSEPSPSETSICRPMCKVRRRLLTIATCRMMYLRSNINLSSGSKLSVNNEVTALRSLGHHVCDQSPTKRLRSSSHRSNCNSGGTQMTVMNMFLMSLFGFYIFYCDSSQLLASQQWRAKLLIDHDKVEIHLAWSGCRVFTTLASLLRPRRQHP